MKVPYRLRRRPADRPAVALLLEGADARPLLGLCDGLGLDPTGRVFAVEGGLLLRLEAPAAGPFPGAVRLRASAANLLLPADAELVPGLLDDEAAGLTAARGLVFLPDGRALAFDPRSPLGPGDLLTARSRPRRDWRALPEPPQLADRIEEILVAWPDPGAGAGEEGEPEATGVEPGPSEAAADAALGPDADSLATEAAPRPPEAGPGRTLAGRAAMGAGGWLIRLGRRLRIEGLARLGARWVGKAVEVAPRLGESVLGRQSAALRELLRQFREGDVEQALRRALPLGEPGESRGARPSSDDRLPTNDLRYSLPSLLGTGGRGPGSAWLGGEELMAELVREYRKAAERAVARGDHRRAASIYGKLLRDYRAAANTLLRGGLPRDAATIFLARLDDPRAAAGAFEAAGEVDRAVQLYRRVGDHEPAGDLLRRIGEEDAAMAEYLAAARKLADTRAGDLAAGNLLRDKAGRPDLALGHYRAGWSRRPDANAVPCALAMLPLLAVGGRLPELLALVDEADAHFEPPGRDHEAAQFYDGLVLLEGPPGRLRDDLRDRALIALAAKLRGNAEAGSGPVSSPLLRATGPWSPAVARDADFALRAARRRRVEAPTPAPSPPPPSPVRIGSGLVTAACAARGTGEVFLGLDGGEVFSFRPWTGEVSLMAVRDDPVAALATRDDGRTLVVLRDGPDGGSLSTYTRPGQGPHRLVLGLTLGEVDAPWLTPVLAAPGGDLFGLWDGEVFHVIEAETFAPRGEPMFDTAGADPPSAGLLYPRRDDQGTDALAYVGNRWCHHDDLTGASTTLHDSVRPGRPEGSSLRAVPFSAEWSGEGRLDLAHVGEHGTLCWLSLRVGDGTADRASWATSAERGGYRAAALVRPGLVAGVTRDRVDWLAAADGRLRPLKSSPCLLDALACFPSPRTNDLIVVGGDGLIRRVPSAV